LFAISVIRPAIVLAIVLFLLCPAETASAGSIVAWGYNGDGQCNIPSPNSGFVAISAGGFHSLGLKSDGSIVAWGAGQPGQSESGWPHFGQCCIPTPNTGFVAISAGWYHSLGVKSDGSIIAWGNNAAFQCLVPEPNNGFTAVAAGVWHSLALRSDGTIVGWGWNGGGQASSPDGNDFVAIATNVGGAHNLALRSDGTIVAWGVNTYGQCNVPSPNSGFIAVAAGSDYSLGLKQDGSIIAWGSNYYGQLNIPFPNTGFVAVAAGEYYSLGLKADGSIVAWGGNDYSHYFPVPSGNDFIAIAAGKGHSLAIVRDVDEDYHIHDTNNFKIYYFITGEHAVDLSDDNHNSVPDFVEKVGESFENAHTFLVGELGFDSPLPPEGKLEVDIKNIGIKYYGDTQSLFGYTWIIINNLLSTNQPPGDSDLNGDGVDDGMIQFICAHEYFHAIQYVTFGQPLMVYWNKFGRSWIPEGSAEWAGYKTFTNYYSPVQYPDGKSEFLNKVSNYLGQPERSLFELEYAAGLYWYYIDVKFGCSKIHEILQRFKEYSYPPDIWLTDWDTQIAINRALLDRNYDFNKSFKDFSKENYFWRLYKLDRQQSPSTYGIPGDSPWPYSVTYHTSTRATNYLQITDQRIGTVRIGVKDSGFDSSFFARAYPNGNPMNEVIIPINGSIDVAGPNTVIIINRFAGLNPFAEDSYEITVSTIPQGPQATGTLHPAGSIVNYVPVDSTVSKAAFHLSWPGSDLDLTLTSPTGIVIDPAYADSDPNITYVEEDTAEYYIVENPEPGQWQMHITAIDVPLEGEKYTATAYLTTNLVLILSSDKETYDPNEPVNLTAELLYDSNSYSDANVTATIVRPDGNEVITLFDDGLHNDANSNDGIYANTFANTAIEGQYDITATASGRNPFGEPFIRETSKTILVKNLPDLVPTSLLTTDGPVQGQITLTATILNNGTKDANDVLVQFYDVNDANVVQIGTDIEIDDLAAQEVKEISVVWNAPEGAHTVIVVVDPLDAISEKDEKNNYIGKTFCAGWEPQGDINNDCVINLLDMAEFANNWLRPCSAPAWCSEADLNKSGQADIFDMRVLAEHWLEYVTP